MKHIKINTKAGKRYLNMYLRSRNYTLYDCYKNPSAAKERENMLCRLKMQEERGSDYKIISYNTFYFSAAWQTEDGKGIRVETPTYSIIIN